MSQEPSSHHPCSSPFIFPNRHKAELERLKQQDPEFFKFLEKNDGRLLEFGEDEEEEDEEEEDEEEEPEEEADEEEEAEPEEEGKGPKELTLALLRQLERSALEERSLKGLRKLVLAFKAASHVADESSKSGANPQQMPYSIASSAVFDQLLVTCLSNLPGAFGFHLFKDPDFSASDPQPFAKLGSNPSFRRIKPLVYRSLKALHYLLGQVTEPSLLGFLLARLERFLPFLIPFPKQVRLHGYEWMD